MNKQPNITNEATRLRLFPFSLRGDALEWLEDFSSQSIHTWDELVAKFLSKYFSPGRMVPMRYEILKFRQHPNEALYEIWERYQRMVKDFTNNVKKDVF